MTVRPSFLDNGVTAFPFDTKGALVYNSGMARSQRTALRGQRKDSDEEEELRSPQ